MEHLDQGPPMHSTLIPAHRLTGASVVMTSLTRSTWQVPILALFATLTIAVASAFVGPLLLLPLLVAATLIALVHWPGVVLAAYLLIPLYKGFAQPFLPADLTVLLAVANVASLAIAVLLGERLRIDPRGFALWVLLTLIVAMGTLYAPDRAVAVASLAQWVALVAVPLLAVLRITLNPRRVDQFASTLFVFGCVMVILGLLAYTPADRVTALGTSTLGVSRAALLVPILTIAWARGRLRWLGMVLSPFAIFIALSTGSRAPVIALGVLALVWGMTMLRRSPARALAFAGLMIVATFGALFFLELPQAAMARFDALLSAAARADADAWVDTSIGTRLQLFDVAWSRFLQSPVIGWGTDAFEVHNGTFLFSYPHSLLLEIAADLGTIGLTVVAAIIVVAVRRSRQWPAILAVLGFTLLNNVVGGAAFEDRMVWGMLLLPLLAGSRDDDTPATASHAAGGP